MKLLEEMMKEMDGCRCQGMTPSTNMNFKGEEENHTRKLLIIDFIRFTKFNKIRNVLNYGYSILTIKI